MRGGHPGFAKRVRPLVQIGKGQPLSYDDDADTAGESVVSDPTPWLKPFRWKPGQSGMDGRKREDLSARIARSVFRSNPEGIRRAMLRVLLAGSVRGFEVLSNRAFGMLPRPVEVKMSAAIVNIPAELVSLVEELESGELDSKADSNDCK